MHGDLTMLGIDELLEMRDEINRELSGRAAEELENMDRRRRELELLIGNVPPAPVDELKERRTRKAGVAKFRNPANPDQTWTGRGKRPAWMNGAVDLTPFQIAA